ncbi:MAG: metallophosphoesterase [Chloroflexi bacterium]|nr:metallophosphoesterase [Chloroflexota bacterium]
MRITFSSDMHGDDAKFQQLLAFARSLRAEVIVLGGDNLPHRAFGRDLLDGQRQYATNALARSLSDLLALCPVYLIPGNDDFAAAYADLRDRVSNPELHLVHGAIAALPDGRELVGYACVPQTPFSLKDFDRRDLAADAPVTTPASALISSQDRMVSVSTPIYLASQPSIEEELALLPVPHNPGRAVYVFHSPPFGIGLDTAWSGEPLGSKAIASFVELHQPLATLHGHIHEAPACSGTYVAYVGRTMCVNPGQERGRLHAISFDTRDPFATLTHSLIGL